MIAEVLELSESGLSDSLRAEWAELLTRVPRYSMSQTPAYGELAMQVAAARGDRAFVVTVRSQGGLAGVWPLTLKKEGPLNVIRPASCGTNEEYGGPLARLENDTAILGAIMAKAATLPCDVLYLHNIAQDDPLSSVIASPPFSKIPTRRDPISGYSLSLSKYRRWADYLAHSSSSHRKGLRHDLRRLKDLGEVSIGHCQTPRAVERVGRKPAAWTSISGCCAPITRKNCPIPSRPTPPPCSCFPARRGS
jgi:CelD/BcsL family acetyltransferase involved in cellulose biosynthesis